MGITLTVTAKGQVTFRKEVMEHLGVRPGDRLDLDLLPDGRLQLRAKPSKPASTIFGMLKKFGQPTLTIAQIKEAAAEGWASKR